MVSFKLRGVLQEPSKNWNIPQSKIPESLEASENVEKFERIQFFKKPPKIIESCQECFTSAMVQLSSDSAPSSIGSAAAAQWAIR